MSRETKLEPQDLRRLGLTSGIVGVQLASVVIFVAGAVMVLLPVSANIVEAYFGTTLALNGGDPLSIQAIDGMLPIANAAAGTARALFLAVLVAALFYGRLAGKTMGWIGAILAVIALAGSLTVIIPELFMLVVAGSVLFLLWFGVLIIGLMRGWSHGGRGPELKRPTASESAQ